MLRGPGADEDGLGHLDDLLLRLRRVAPVLSAKRVPPGTVRVVDGHEVRLGVAPFEHGAMELGDEPGAEEAHRQRHERGSYAPSRDCSAHAPTFGAAPHVRAACAAGEQESVLPRGPSAAAWTWPPPTFRRGLRGGSARILSLHAPHVPARPAWPGSARILFSRPRSSCGLRGRGAQGIVPQLFGRRLGAKPSWDQLREHLREDLSERWPATDFHLGDETVAWTDGPAESAVVDAVADVPGWQPVIAGRPPPETRSSSLLLLRRSFSDRALAVAVVRYRSSGARPFESEREGRSGPSRDLLDVDDPGTSGYPLTDAIADLLQELPYPRAEPDGLTPADRWSAKLEALDFNALWNRAWAETDL